LHSVQTWGLATHCVDTSRNNVDVPTISNQTAKKPFGDRATANITGADKEDTFHGSNGASERHFQPRSEPAQVNVKPKMRRNSRFSAARIAAILVDGSVGFPDMTIDTLRQVPLFESLDNEAADELRQLLTSIDSKAGAFLFRHGEQGDAMYIIEQGKVRICVQTLDGHQFTLTELGRGDFFGEMALLDGQHRSADALVSEDARLAVLSRDHFLSFMRSNPNVALEMLTALVNRLRHTDELLRHSTTRNVNVEEAAQLTLADRASDVIAEFGGSWKFILAAVFFFNVWVWVNASLQLLGKTAFDAYPYLMLSTAINMLAVLQAPIILMSQNRQAHKDRLRAEIDYQVNLKNELALNEIIERLKTLERESLQLASDKESE